ncbi:hypothetical protein BO71DRAFT_414582 [Aspergillus ellipticus CBS 707.79]|uniref:Condensation domain-containing protein n=1 Tax=Aspergillus ellipticus CBS 707.79 TaxID=1448320 RepID=A0A319D9R5_9EURO|nr:hypothetical protein BO71DRAFT_414582 [Aspergillus ellipticus CBS 707.79]
MNRSATRKSSEIGRSKYGSSEDDPPTGAKLALQTLDLTRGTVVACQIRVPPSLDPDQLRATVESAIGQVVQQHPLLRAGLVGEESTTPAWIDLTDFHLSDHITWHTLAPTADLQQARQTTIQEALDTRFTSYATLPGWRMTCHHVSGSLDLEVIFTFNHTHIDGVSVKIILEDFLQTLTTSSFLPAPPLHHKLFPLPAEHLTPIPIPIPIPIPLTLRLQTLWTQLLSGWWPSATTPSKPQPNPKPDWAPIHPAFTSTPIPLLHHPPNSFGSTPPHLPRPTNNPNRPPPRSGPPFPGHHPHSPPLREFHQPDPHRHPALPALL